MSRVVFVVYIHCILLNRTSLKYSSPSEVKGTRFMLVSEVALGNSYETTVIDTELKKPPIGFHSVHGVRRTENQSSDFEVRIPRLVILYTGIS